MPAKNMGASPSPVPTVAGVPVSRWKLLEKDAPNRKEPAEAKPAPALRMEQHKMREIIGPLEKTSGKGTTKAGKMILRFIEGNYEKLNPEDTLALLQELAINENVQNWEIKRYDEVTLRERTLELARMLERRGYFNGISGEGTEKMTVKIRKILEESRETENTGYARLMMGLVECLLNPPKDVLNQEMPRKAYCSEEEVCYAALFGSKKVDSAHWEQLRRLRFSIAAGVVSATVSAGLAMGLIAQSIAGEASLPMIILTACAGTLSIIAAVRIKRIWNAADYSLWLINLAKVGDELSRYAVDGKGGQT